MTATAVRVPDPFAANTFAVGAAKHTNGAKNTTNTAGMKAAVKTDDVRKLQIRVAAQRDSILASALMAMYPVGRKHG